MIAMTRHGSLKLICFATNTTKQHGRRGKKELQRAQDAKSKGKTNVQSNHKSNKGTLLRVRFEHTMSGTAKYAARLTMGMRRGPQPGIDVGYRWGDGPVAAVRSFYNKEPIAFFSCILGGLGVIPISVAATVGPS